MTRCNSFARGALFAAGGAAGWLAWAVVAAPAIGTGRALATYLVGLSACYAAGLVPERAGGSSARRVGFFIAAGAGAALVAFCAHDVTELAIGLAALVGVARSGFLYRAAPARAVVTEVLLLGGGLLFARFLAAHTLTSTALALWGFLLMQSFFFLVAGVRVRRGEAEIDPFDAAHRHAVALLERNG